MFVSDAKFAARGFGLVTCRSFGEYLGEPSRRFVQTIEELDFFGWLFEMGTPLRGNCSFLTRKSVSRSNW